MTNRIEKTINSIKARIESEVKKDSPDWDAIKKLADNGRIAEGQIQTYTELNLGRGLNNDNTRKIKT